MIVNEFEQQIEQDPDPDPGPSRQEVVPTRSGHRRFLLNRFEDFVLSSRTAVPHVPEPVQDPTPPAGTHCPSPSPSVRIPEPVFFTTDCDDFGLYCEYITFPTTDPEADQDLDDIYDIPGKLLTESGQCWWTGVGVMFNAATENIYHPFLNAMVYWLMS